MPSPPEKPPGTAILCGTCGNACRGEVLRVQDKHFHVACFVCKGERAASVPPCLAAAGPASGHVPGELARESGIPEDPASSLQTTAWPASLTGVARKSGSEDVARPQAVSSSSPTQCPRVWGQWPEQSSHLSPRAGRSLLVA